jgi:transposase
VPDDTLLEKLAESLALNERLAAENAALRDRIAALEAELGRNSENSSKPPSADPVGPRQSRAERRAAAREAGRRQGKQPGAGGSNLARRDPEVTVEHPATCCAGCGSDLSAAPVVGSEVRQVIDVAPVTVTVTDHGLVSLGGSAHLGRSPRRVASGGTLAVTVFGWASGS